MPVSFENAPLHPPESTSRDHEAILPGGYERWAINELWRRRVAKAIATFAILDSLYVGLYKVPIAVEQERLSQTHVSISQALSPAAGADKDMATVILGGFGTRDSEPIAEALSPLRQLGEVDSIVEDDNGVSAESLARQIMKRSLAHDITSLGLWGDSLGGPVLTEVARIIQQSDSNLHVAYIVLDCSPTSFESLRPDKKQTIQTLDFWSNILPDLPYHPAVNYFYTSSQMGENPVYAASGVHGGAIIDKMNDEETPSTALLDSQLSFVIDPHLKDNLEAISKVTTKTAPVIISIRPTSPTGDAVVNSTVASKELADIMAPISMEYHALTIGGISHGDPTIDTNRRAYRGTLEKIIIPLMKERETIPPRHEADGQLYAASTQK